MMPVGQPEDRATVGTDPSAALPLEQVALPLAATLPKFSAFATLRPTRQTGKRNRQPYYFSFFFFVEGFICLAWRLGAWRFRWPANSAMSFSAEDKLCNRSAAYFTASLRITHNAS